MGSEWAKKAKNRFWEKKKVFQLKDSLFSKHSRGKPISKEEKKILCNVFQSFYDENGHNKDRAIKKTSKVCGFSVRAIAQIVKERAVSGTVIGNVQLYFTFLCESYQYRVSQQGPDERNLQLALNQSSFAILNLFTVFENQLKSRIQHCEHSKLRLLFEWTKIHQKCQRTVYLDNFLKTCWSIVIGQRLVKN